MKIKMKKGDIMWIALCAAVFVLFLAQGLCIGLEGDDLSYSAYCNYYGGGLLHYPRWVARHWALTNGRAANYLAPLMLYFSPRWLMAALNAVAAAMYLYFAGRCLPMGGAWAKCALAAMLLLTMAWWDSSTLFDVSFNYVWASAFGLGFVSVWMRLRADGAPAYRLWSVAALGAFAFIAGQMHEAMSAPLCAGIGAYYLMGRRWRSIGRVERIFALCFLAGAILCISSPGIWSRFNAERVPDDTPGVILIKSDFYVLALLAVSIISVMLDRKRLERLMATEWIVFAVAAVASMCFSAVGGIVGRSGWFAQTYALIALVWYFWPARGGSMLKVSVSMLTAVAVACWAVMTMVQHRLGAEARQASALYWQSPTGTFYMDHAGVDDLPWWTLGRPRGAISNSDDYSRLIYESEYRPGKPYAMLPAWAEGMGVDSLLARDGFSLAPRAEFMLHDNPYHGFWRDADGNVLVEVKAVHHGSELYYSEKLEPAPGYRIPGWPTALNQ